MIIISYGGLRYEILISLYALHALMKFLIMFSKVEIYSSIMHENISLNLPVSNIELTFG